ncbi:ribonuclease P protein component [Sphingorhabdus sp. 109]|jgi:ribonuclease P protein component|uniref:ribonuclease P protein component n=1 Tax=Sphingorhabdus sp. 109 TaxID=2653173 RepID=UPI0012F0586A|nr:ribonuclease P protein component [Sphingorhabdus sp. 109]VWX60871.1 Ribonuclease P protein component [Sphingorhabdus sp. 109]
MTARAAPVEARPSPDHLDLKNPSADSAFADSNQPIEVIRKRADFLAANRGKRFVTPHFVLLAHRRRPDHPVEANSLRYGITVTKKIGNAVARNRMKRRFRALLAQSLPDHGIAGVDHIMIGRKTRNESDFATMRADLEKGLKFLAKKLGQAG